MLLQPEKLDFIIAMTKEAEAHKIRIHWTLMRNNEVKNKRKNKYGKLNTTLSILYFKCKRFTTWKSNKIKVHTLCTWMNAIMGSQIRGNLCASGKFDKCDVTLRYRKYT